MPLMSRSPTETERRRRQRRVYELLDEFLTLGDKRNLPFIHWNVGEFALVGTCLQPAPADRRAAFEQWVTALRLDRWDDSPRGGGYVHLHARTENWQGRRVDVAVMADIDTEAL